jgi:phosphoglucosamine mutase
MRVVVDCANGAGYAVSPQALQELGAEVFSIAVNPDGFNINREVGSTATAALVAEVKARRADIGIALDGDADRVVLVDEKGQFVDGDQLLAVIAASWAEDGRLAKPAIVVTVMSNLGLERYLKGIGVGLVRTQVGDRYVAEAMREQGHNLGGEQSGHIIMSDYTTTGDGLVAALQLLAVVKKLNRPVSEICHRFERVPQVLKSVKITNGGRPLENGKIRSLIDAARGKLAERGRLVVRASGTEPVIRVMAEGDDRDMIEAVVAELVSILREAGAAEDSGRAA